MSGRISRAHSQLQQQHLNYIDARAISDTRAKFVYSGHCVFKGLVKSDIALAIRKEASMTEPSCFESIFNDPDKSTSMRRMCKAGILGHNVNRAIMEFLRTRALIATKWHNIELGRYSVYLRSAPGLKAQTPHTDFDPAEMCKVWSGQPEFEMAKSFSIMVALQATRLYFVDANGILVPENLTAGDVVVFAGDVDHCGAEWNFASGKDAYQAFGDRFNYRLFSYVPSCYKPEFLVPWIVNSKNSALLTAISDEAAQADDLFERTDPDKAKFSPDLFKKYLRYGGTMYYFSEQAYVLGIDTFPTRDPAQRRLPKQVIRNESGAPCPHLSNVSTKFFATDGLVVGTQPACPEKVIQSQLQQLRRNCSFCTKPQKRARSSPPSSSITSIQSSIANGTASSATNCGLKAAAQVGLACSYSAVYVCLTLVISWCLGMSDIYSVSPLAEFGNK